MRAVSMLSGLMMATGLMILLATAVRAGEPAREIKLTWIAHSCFQITTSQGTRIVIDPYDEKIGYKLPKLAADLVLVTHLHADHNNAEGVGGKPKIWRGIEANGEREFKGVSITGISAYHDETQGSKRGVNTMFVLAVDDLHICHLGDLGHLLGPKTLERLGKVDVLLVPVGGFYTLDIPKVDQLIDSIKPRIVIPMHFKTEQSLSKEISPVSVFLKTHPDARQLGKDTITLTAEGLPKTTEVWVMDYAAKEKPTESEE